MDYEKLQKQTYEAFLKVFTTMDWSGLSWLAKNKIKGKHNG